MHDARGMTGGTLWQGLVALPSSHHVCHYLTALEILQHLEVAACHPSPPAYNLPTAADHAAASCRCRTAVVTAYVSASCRMVRIDGPVGRRVLHPKTQQACWVVVHPLFEITAQLFWQDCWGGCM